MAKPSDAMKANMDVSLARRPAAAMGHIGASGASKEFEGRSKLNGACSIELSKIVADPLQPRTDWDSDEARDELGRLAESLKTRGQLQPIRVRWMQEQGVYQVVVGGRRFRAAGMAGLKSVECVVISGNPTAEDILEDQLVENALRLANSPIEQARSYERLIAAKGYTHRELAERLNINHSGVTQAMGLLNLPAPIQSAVDSGEIKPTIAYEISKVADVEEQADLATQAKAGTLKRDALRAKVTQSRTEAASKPKGRGDIPRRAPAPAKPSPYTFETDEYIVTIQWKRADGPPAKTIAGNLVRQLNIEAKARKGQGSGQGGESDAA